MVIYKTNTNYSVYLEENGDGYWINVRNELGEHEDLNVGFDDENDWSISSYIHNAYTCFSPTNYVKEHLDNNSDRYSVLHIATTAFEIDRALEEAYNAAKVNEYIFQTH